MTAVGGFPRQLRSIVFLYGCGLYFLYWGSIMKRTLMIAVFTTLVATGTYAVAQDQTQQGSQTSNSSSDYSGNKNETMEQCMARQKATNSGLTHMQMQTTCRNEINANKTRKEGNDLATGPQGGEKQPQNQQ